MLRSISSEAFESGLRDRIGTIREWAQMIQFVNFKEMSEYYDTYPLYHTGQFIIATLDEIKELEEEIHEDNRQEFLKLEKALAPEKFKEYDRTRIGHPEATLYHEIAGAYLGDTEMWKKVKDLFGDELKQFEAEAKKKAEVEEQE